MSFMFLLALIRNGKFCGIILPLASTTFLKDRREKGPNYFKDISLSEIWQLFYNFPMSRTSITCIPTLWTTSHSTIIGKRSVRMVDRDICGESLQDGYSYYKA